MLQVTPTFILFSRLFSAHWHAYTREKKDLLTEAGNRMCLFLSMSISTLQYLNGIRKKMQTTPRSPRACLGAPNYMWENAYPESIYWGRSIGFSKNVLYQKK